MVFDKWPLKYTMIATTLVNNHKKKGQKNMNGPLYHIPFQLNPKCAIKSKMNERIYIEIFSRIFIPNKNYFFIMQLRR